jgi:hypothetical protein
VYLWAPEKPLRKWVTDPEKPDETQACSYDLYSPFVAAEMFGGRHTPVSERASAAVKCRRRRRWEGWSSA